MRGRKWLKPKLASSRWQRFHRKSSSPILVRFEATWLVAGSACRESSDRVDHFVLYMEGWSGCGLDEGWAGTRLMRYEAPGDRRDPGTVGWATAGCFIAPLKPALLPKHILSEWP